MNISEYRNKNAPALEDIPALQAGETIAVVEAEERPSKQFGSMLVLTLADGSKRRSFSASLLKNFTVEGHTAFEMLKANETVEGTIVQRTEITKDGKKVKTRPFLDIE